MELDFSVMPDETFLKEGTHYVECTKAEYTKSPHGDWGYELTWTCLEEGKRGRTMRDRLYASWKGDPSAKMTSRLKIAAGALNMMPPKGQKANIPPTQWIGKRCWIEVVEGEPYQARDGKMRTSFQVTFAGYDTETPPPRELGGPPLAPAVPASVVVAPQPPPTHAPTGRPAPF